MPEYIDREALIHNLKQFSLEQLTPLIESLIQKQPTADVVEVVRCKDCAFSREFKIWEKESGYEGLLKCECNIFRNNRRVVFDKHYCSYGERKEVDDK